MKTAWTKRELWSMLYINTVYSSAITKKKNFQVSSPFNNFLYEKL